MRQSSLVEKIKVRRDWIAVWFETGLMERWTFDIPDDPPRYRRLPPDSELIKKDIEILDEDPQGFDAIFSDGTQEVDNFLVRPEDIAMGGFVDRRLLVHKIVYRLLSEGWYQPSFNPDRVKADWERLKDVRTKSVIVSRSFIRMSGQMGKRNVGNMVWAHYFNLGAYTRGIHALRECYDEPKLICRAVEKLIRRKMKITRSTLLYAILSLSFHSFRGKKKQKRIGPFGFRPHVYCDIFEKVMMVKKPVILDMTPDLGSKAMATAMMNGVYGFPSDNKVMARSKDFEKFSGCSMLPGFNGTADLGIIGGIECLSSADDALKNLDYVRKRAATTMVFVREPDHLAVLNKAPTDQRIQIHYGGSARRRGKILLYSQT